MNLRNCWQFFVCALCVWSVGCSSTPSISRGQSPDSGRIVDPNITQTRFYRDGQMWQGGEHQYELGGYSHEEAVKDHLYHQNTNIYGGMNGEQPLGAVEQGSGPGGCGQGGCQNGMCQAGCQPGCRGGSGLCNRCGRFPGHGCTCPCLQSDGQPWTPKHNFTYSYQQPTNLQYPSADSTGGAVVYPYYTHKGPSDFFRAQ